MSSFVYVLVISLSVSLIEAKEGKHCNSSTRNNKLDIPLISTLNAPLVAQLDIGALTEQLKALIKNEVKTSVSLVVQNTVETIVGNKLVLAERSLEEKIKAGINESSKRPMFFVYLRAVQTSFRGNDILKFDDVRINKGGHYDVRTGKFTAPTSGVYQVSFLLMGFKQSDVTFQLHKNNEVYYHGYAVRSKYHYASQGSTLLVSLQLGDQVYIKHQYTASQIVQGNRHSYFSARLL